jgi:hypothetical protein
VFTVIDTPQIEANHEDFRRPVDDSCAELAPGERETWIDFAFYPAVPDQDLARLREMWHTLGELVEAGQTRQIDCLRLYVAQLQLRIHLSLLLGDHAAAGRALAGYSAIMQSAAEYFAQQGTGGDAVSGENRPQALAMLDNHGGFAEYAGRRLLAYGRSHEFVDQSEQANATWDAIVKATRTSADTVFQR